MYCMRNCLRKMHQVRHVSCIVYTLQFSNANNIWIILENCTTYRVTLVVEYLGWVDLDLGCSTILLGQ